MNNKDFDILKLLLEMPYVSSDIISDLSGCSIAAVNRAVRRLTEGGFLDDSMQATAKGRELVNSSVPKNAVILAAGTGSRMVPINTLYTKGMLEVNGETLVERIILQLKSSGIKEIYVVAGYMKEEYERLEAQYGVQLIVNRDFRKRGSLYSLSLAKKHISNTYIVPCDVWCRENPFSRHEMYSWYMVNELVDDDSLVRVDRKKELQSVPAEKAGNGMVGLAYVSAEDAEKLVAKLSDEALDAAPTKARWETALFSDEPLIRTARVVRSVDFVEIDTYEQLRELDEQSGQLRSYAIAIIMKELGVKELDITDIAVLKNGMTNRSFLFSCKGERYIMRIPKEGTNRMINRRQEALVYSLINGRNICDELAYINPDNGYKITKFIDHARTCDPNNIDEVHHCIEKLRWFHEQRLQVEQEFDIYRQIDFLQSLWQHEKSVYEDYRTTKNNIHCLKSFVDSQKKELCLSHCDVMPDNFIIFNDEYGNEKIRIIDWEYAAMHDPHSDLAMFCVNGLYSREQIDELIDFYFRGSCDLPTRTKMYCYIAACGLMWSNWCEYKYDLGVEMGEYAAAQYRYAVDYYRIAADNINMIEKGDNNVQGNE